MSELQKIAEAYEEMKSIKVRSEPVPVNESSLTHILGHKARGYGIISACRSENDKQRNDELSKKLRKDIRDAGFGFIPVHGGFRETTDDGRQVDVFETAYLVPCHNMDGIDHPFDYLAEVLVELGQKYGQESVLLCPPNGNPKYVVTKEYEDSDENGNSIKHDIGDVSMEFPNGVKLNDLTQTYFTSLNTIGKHPTNPLGKNVRRFTFESATFPGDSLTYQTGHRRHYNGEINRVRHD